MLGWFKKKFKKQDKAAPQETPVRDDRSSDTPFSEEEQLENGAAPAGDPLPPSAQADVEDTAGRAVEGHLDTRAVEEGGAEKEYTPEDDIHETVTAAPVSTVTTQDPAAETDPEREKIAESTEALPETVVESETPDEIVPPPEPSAEDEQEVPATAPLPRVQPPSEKPGTPVQETTAGEGEPAVDKAGKQVFAAKEQPAAAKKKTLFSRLSERLGKTRETLTYQIDALFLGKKEISADLLDDLEEILITADLGVGTSQELIDYARRKVKRKELADVNSLKKALKKKIRRFIAENDQDATLVMPDKGPFVIMVIGVNGVGKTTTIGKIANKFVKSGSSVLLAAGDTFRAAAVAQLKIWGERNNVDVVAHQEGADPSSVAYDAIEKAVAKEIDVVLIDTAGRMHTKDNLMEELKKIKRVMGKKLAGAPHEVMLVIDATTGQNGISQAKLFDAAVDVTGITLTKLDGTSKGGIVVNICREMKIPIRFIGIGEQMDDLRDFDAGEFADALFESRDSKTH